MFKKNSKVSKPFAPTAPKTITKRTIMIVATKIIYEALGQEHICYAPKELTEFQITKIIKGIADTSVVTRISYNCRISEKEFYKQNIKLVEKWIEDLKTYENEPV